MTRRRAAAIGWAVSIGALTVADIYLNATAPDCTLSHTGRTTFRVEHPVGEAAFVLGWLGLTAWLVPHIVKPGRAARRARAVATSVTALNG